MAARLQKILFLTLLFFIPIQFGKHFWPSFAFITGVRIDYLSPTLYATDIIWILLFLTLIFEKKIGLLFSPLLRLRGRTLQIAVLFSLTVILSTVFSESPITSWYALMRFTQMGLLVLYIVSFVNKRDMLYVTEVFGLGGLLVSLIAFFQIGLQHSVGGILYFLGERTFSVSSIGIATMHTPNGLFLRPYATFPHPNVLAFYLLCAIVFSTLRLSIEKEKKERIFLGLVSAVSSIALLLTFSRITILCWVFFIIFMIGHIIRKKYAWFLGIGLLLLVPFLAGRFIDVGKDLGYRMNLMGVSWSIFQKHPFIGVGLAQFYEHETLYQKIFSPVFLQPVHNIFILLMVELGLLGFICILYFLILYATTLFSALKKSTDQEMYRVNEGFLLLTGALLVVGMFDHFFVTLYQGQLLMAVLIGFGVRVILRRE